MLDGIIDKVKEFAQEAIQGSSDIADDKKDLALKTTSDTLVDSIKEFFSGDGSIVDKAKDLFSEEGGFFDNAKDKVSAALTGVGIDASQVEGFVSSFIPNIKQALSDKFSLDNFSFDGIVEAITGAEDDPATPENEAKSGLLGKITSFFKK